MSSDRERRQLRDRRRWPRGGRRAGDLPGYSPLVLVADDDTDSAARCEAILAALRFAVAPARSIEEALSVMRALRPNLVVANLRDAGRLEREMAKNHVTAEVPVIIVTDALRDPMTLVEEIRRVLRARLAGPDSGMA
jgi:DNA-binding NtrC family response regulator